MRVALALLACVALAPGPAAGQSAPGDADPPNVLFHLEDDLGEHNNVAGQHPARVERIRERLHDWYEERDARFLRAGDGGPKPWRPEK